MSGPLKACGGCRHPDCPECFPPRTIGFRAIKFVREVSYWRALSHDDSSTTEDLREFYKEGWRVVAIATDNGLPHFVMERETAVECEI